MISFISKKKKYGKCIHVIVWCMDKQLNHQSFEKAFFEL